MALAAAKLAYQRFKATFHGPPFAALRLNGARPQRLLWASTKNPAYPELMYVLGLVGPETVNTLPLATLYLARDRLRPRPSLEEGVGEAQKVLKTLPRLGVDLGEIAAGLEAEGLAAFAASYDKLLGVLDGKRRALLRRRMPGQTLRLGAYRSSWQARLSAWEVDGFCRRLWARDPTLWGPEVAPEGSGWLG